MTHSCEMALREIEGNLQVCQCIAKKWIGDKTLHGISLWILVESNVMSIKCAHSSFQKHYAKLKIDHPDELDGLDAKKLGDEIWKLDFLDMHSLIDVIDTCIAMLNPLF